MKLYFVLPSDTPLAETDPRFLGELTRPFAEAGCVRVVTPDAADAGIINEAFSFKEQRYIDRLKNDPLLGRYLHKTYTINCDDCATGVLKGVYTSIPRDRMHSGVHAVVPYTRYPNEYVLADPPDPRRPPRYLAAWRGNRISNARLRSRLVDTLVGNPDFLIETTDSWLNHGTPEKKSYVELIRAAKYSLCPGGWAPISFRIYESMALGVAPVIIADQCVLPVGPDWGACSIRIGERDVPRIPAILKMREGDSVALGNAARREWSTHFCPERIPDFYASSLLRCIRADGDNRTLQREHRRLSSFKLFWSNGWTLPQRALNKLRKITRR